MNFRIPYHCLTKPSNIIARIDRITIQEHNGEHFIVFPSTSSLTDWILDFIFIRVPIPFLSNKKITAHSGFVHHYERLRHKLYPHLSKRHYHIVGYSMGACLSYLCALDLRLRGHSVEVTVFDPLRIGNRHFRDYYEINVPNTAYITYGNSTVAKLPPYLLGYRHSGIRFQYGPEYKWWKYNHHDHKLENLKPFII
jgi:pimeloyl-ACP methyl ester carboxylesterase